MQHSLNSNCTSNEHSNAKNLCLNEVEFHTNHLCVPNTRAATGGAL